MNEVTITRDEAESLRDFIESDFLNAIRNDPDIDSLTWVKNIISVYEKCGAFNE